MTKMLKTGFGALCMALILMFSMAVQAGAADSDFTIENGVLTKYNGAGGDVVIPAGVTSIGDFAFENCTSLTSATIPDSVTSICHAAFTRCSNLTSVTIPNSVTSIGTEAFCESGLTSVNIPNSITSIADNVFNNCTSLTSVTIPNSVTSIASRAFENCSSLTGITIPDDVTSIGSEAFVSCTGLTSITIPNSVTSMGRSVFSNCTGLTSITIPDSITSIANGAFYGCTGLTSITIPDSVTSIDTCAFYGCTGLTSITIPDSVTSIGISAFSGCTNLKNISISANTTNIGMSVFDDTLWIKEQLKSNDFVILNNILLKYGGSGGNVVIPDGVTSISSNVFYGCTGLTSVTIPGSVKEIKDSAFGRCAGLTSVTIPEGVENIEESAFRECTNLTDITIPGSLKKIGGTTFLDTPWMEKQVSSNNGFLILNNILVYYDCSDTDVVIPDGVTSISTLSFYNPAKEMCTKLNNITIPDSVTSIADQDSVFGAYPFLHLVIHGNAGSYAESYAKEYKLKFEADGVAAAPAPATTSQPTTTPAPSSTPLAYASTQTVKVDGKPIEFQMYALKDAGGNPTNYVKVRDVAQVLNGTPAQFNVTWDGAVNLVPKTAYVSNGSEMKTPYSGDRAYQKVTASTKVNGTATNLEAFTLTDDNGGGYTYYKLRDLGKALGFNVGWSKDQGVFIESDKPYQE